MFFSKIFRFQFFILWTQVWILYDIYMHVCHSLKAELISVAAHFVTWRLSNKSWNTNRYWEVFSPRSHFVMTYFYWLNVIMVWCSEVDSKYSSSIRQEAERFERKENKERKMVGEGKVQKLKTKKNRSVRASDGETLYIAKWFMGHGNKINKLEFNVNYLDGGGGVVSSASWLMAGGDDFGCALSLFSFGMDIKTADKCN